MTNDRVFAATGAGVAEAAIEKFKAGLRASCCGLAMTPTTMLANYGTGCLTGARRSLSVVPELPTS